MGKKGVLKNLSQSAEAAELTPEEKLLRAIDEELGEGSFEAAGLDPRTAQARLLQRLIAEASDLFGRSWRRGSEGARPGCLKVEVHEIGLNQPDVVDCPGPSSGPGER